MAYSLFSDTGRPYELSESLSCIYNGGKPRPRLAINPYTPSCLYRKGSGAESPGGSTLKFARGWVTSVSSRKRSLDAVRQEQLTEQPYSSIDLYERETTCLDRTTSIRTHNLGNVNNDALFDFSPDYHNHKGPAMLFMKRKRQLAVQKQLREDEKNELPPKRVESPHEV